MRKTFPDPSSVRLRLAALLCLVLLPATADAQGHQDWSAGLGIYEVNVRQYTAAGTFSAFATHLDRLQAMGVGILWFMPVHPIGQVNRLGSLGSYYSVRDYLAVNPEFGTLDDFRGLVQAAHDRGMYVLIDWVANHTAWDHVLTTEHPEWYVTDAQGHFIPPPGTNWSDVIELDYAEPGLRAYMIDAMRFWVEDVGVDGFRFDAVDFVPADFWEEAIPELRAARPDLFLLAESDGPEWYGYGFDMTYGWGLYGFGGGILKRIADGELTAANFNGFVAGEKALYPSGYRMYFTSNHDENSWYGTTSELFGAAAEVFAVLTATFHGMPLVYSGQEAGLDKRLAFFDKDQIPWRDHPNTALYSALLHLKRENRALWNGSNGGLLQRVLSTDNTNVFAFVRKKDADQVFVALNLSAQARTVTLSGTTFAGAYRDIFSEDTVILAEGAILGLPAWGYRVYEAIGTNTAVARDALPGGFALGQNYPNPFRSTSTFSYTLAVPSDVRVALYDVLGREVRVLADGTRQAGTYEALLDASDLAGGLYLARMCVDGQIVQTRRTVIAR